MFYFVVDELQVKKYEVEVNKEELKKLKLEIIKNCSEITHCEFDAPNDEGINYLKISNFSKIKKCSNPNLYHFSYDEYEHSYLVHLIDELLLDNAFVLNDIFDINYELEKPTIHERINNLFKEITRLSTSDEKQKKIKLNEIQILFEKSQSNDKQKCVYDYYPKVRDLIKLKLVSFINLIEFSEITKTTNLPIQDNRQKRIQKVL